MLKNKTRLFVFVTSIICLCMISCFAATYNLPNHTEDFYVNDFANILNEETKKYILNGSVSLNEKTKAQIVVVTLDSLGDASLNLDEYSLNLFRKWGIGDKEKNNGLLILLSLSERKIKIEVGRGLEGRINDSKAGRILDEYGVPYFKNDDWNSGMKNLYSALLTEVYAEYNLEVPTEVSEIIANYNSSAEESKIGAVMGFVIMALIVVFGGILPFFLRKKRPGIYGPEDYPPGGGFFGGGGFGGGGFSGGGGTAGGGGASRGF